MASKWADYRVFLGEFRRNFHSTGAILPSGRSLGRALSRFVRDGDERSNDSASSDTTSARKILEVGPGTGAVTARIIQGMRPDDQLDLVELNDQFVARLKDRLENDPAFAAAKDRTTIYHLPVEQLEGDGQYDLIVSGLPLNNFSVEAVETILAALRRLLKPGGTLSFFEYIAVRPLRAIVSGRADRARLRGVGQLISSMITAHEIRRDLIWPNVPPAWVHHVRLAEASPEKVSGTFIVDTKGSLP